MHNNFFQGLSFEANKCGALKDSKKECDALPSSLMDSYMSLNRKQRKNKELGHIPWLIALWGQRGVLELQDGTRKSDKHQLLTWTCTKLNIRWSVHSWSTFGAKTSHGQIRTHKIHHGPDLGEATTFPFIIYFMLLHEAHIQMAFCPMTPKWESQNSQSWDSYNFGAP